MCGVVWLYRGSLVDLIADIKQAFNERKRPL
jgi:hypothetical protein